MKYICDDLLWGSFEWSRNFGLQCVCVFKVPTYRRGIFRIQCAENNIEYRTKGECLDHSTDTLEFKHRSTGVILAVALYKNYKIFQKRYFCVA